jgi:hypothetical protein
MIELFNDQLLNKFVENFYGYGNYNGQFWFIGMEEGGGNSFLEINKRLNAWRRSGRHALEDVVQYHTEIGLMDWFNDKPKLQPTWNKLIRILLSSNGQLPTTEQVRKYQKILLGRRNGDTCLVELLPLPSPSVGLWLYTQHSRLPYLTNRETYKQCCLPLRIKYLRDRINQYKPKAVVFYGLSYYKYWQIIAEIDFWQGADKIYSGYNGTTFFVMTKHPTAQGVTNEYFHQVGRLIAASNEGQ